MVVNEIHGNVLMRMLSVTYNTHTHTSRIIYRLLCLGCPENDVRFVGSELSNEGRVEFCQEGVWQVICPGGIDPTSATVVCRQLGHNPIGGEDRSNVHHQHSKLLFSIF